LAELLFPGVLVLSVVQKYEIALIPASVMHVICLSCLCNFSYLKKSLCMFIDTESVIV